MEPITRPTVTMPRAAHAAGFSLRGLREVMTYPGRIKMLGQPNRAAAKRHRFAAVDVVRLALVRRLLDYGFTVAGAQHVLDRSVDNHLGGLVGCGVDLPPVFLLNRLDGLHLHVASTKAGVAVRTTWVSMPDSGHEATLTINLGVVAADALRRLTSPQPLTPTSAGTPAKESPC